MANRCRRSGSFYSSSLFILLLLLFFSLYSFFSIDSFHSIYTSVSSSSAIALALTSALAQSFDTSPNLFASPLYPLIFLITQFIMSVKSENYSSEGTNESGYVSGSDNESSYSPEIIFTQNHLRFLNRNLQFYEPQGKHITPLFFPIRE